MEIGLVRKVDIDHEMQQSYLDYAMSVIVRGPCPMPAMDLKPVQRRVFTPCRIWASGQYRFKKSARIVGEVLGKYHPHGDGGLRIDGAHGAGFLHALPARGWPGNFGSVDGDAPAAMRYTEARLHKMAEEMLADLEKNTVDFTDNFDGSLKEPLVLPSRLPNLLLNGSSGIAVGMATNIPPHNLKEVASAIIYLIDNYDRWKKSRSSS